MQNAIVIDENCKNCFLFRMKSIWAFHLSICIIPFIRLIYGLRALLKTPRWIAFSHGNNILIFQNLIQTRTHTVIYAKHATIFATIKP